MTGIRNLLRNRKARNWGLIVMFIYIFLYLWSIGHIHFGNFNSIFKISILDNWTSLLTRNISPFLYEPLGYIELFNSVRFLIAPANILLGLFLSILVFLNIASVIYIYSMPKQCRIDVKVRGLVGILPSFLSGFACCLPSILIPLASILGSTTAFFSRVFQWLLPISILLLLYGVISSLKKIKELEGGSCSNQ